MVDDARDGRSLSNALKTPNRAVAIARPGDVVCFDEGTYPTLRISGMKATAGAPLVFRTIPGKEQKATFTTGVIGSGTGIYIEFSDHVHIYDLRVATSQKGVEYLSGSFGRIEGLMIEKLGQEAIAHWTQAHLRWQ